MKWLLPAAATTVTPDATSRQIAWWIGSWLVSPQLWSSEPVFATDMLAASISGRVGSAGSRWAVIQSRPQTYHETRPAPLEFRMRTAHRRTPGATPTTPWLLSIAPTMPATCVPWPLPSSQAFGLEVEQFTPPTTLRSGLSLSIPVSTIATSASTRSSTPSIFAIWLFVANTRRTPRGVDWASSRITPSGTSATTFGSARRAATCVPSSLAE